MKKKYWKGLVIGLMLTVCLVGTAPAADRYWVGGTEEYGYPMWYLPANWQGGVMPVPGDNVYIGPEAGFLISKDGYVAYNYHYPANGYSGSINELSVSGNLFASATLEFVGFGWLPTDYTTIGGSGTGIFKLNWGTHVVNQDLIIDGGFPGKSGYYEMGSGTLSVGNQTYVGKYGIGVFTQNDGYHRTQWDLNIGYGRDINPFGNLPPRIGEGTYNLNGGILEANFQYVGGDDVGIGLFNQNGGSNTAFQALVIGAGASNQSAQGTYTLNNGILSASNLFVGNWGTGTFTQTGGSNFIGVNPDGTIQADLHELIVGRFEGSQGIYNQSGGILHVKREVVGDAGFTNGTFNQTGDSQHTIYEDLIIGQDPMSVGIFTLSDDARLHVKGSIILGDEGGTGTFMQSGNSSLTVDSSLAIGVSSESGNTPGTGTFTQTGGKVKVGSLGLGTANGAIGTYNLAGGTLESDNSYIGDWGGTGYFHQWDGDHIVKGMTSVGTLFPSDNNFYNLYGGTLTTADLVIGNSATGTFNQGGDASRDGGLVTVTRDLSLGAVNWWATGTYNLNKGKLTVANDLNVGLYGTGTFNFSGGQIDIGSYNGGLPTSTLRIGAYGTGTGSSSFFNQSGGTMMLYGSMVIGENAGSFGAFKLSETDGVNNPAQLTVQDIKRYDNNNNVISEGGVIIGKSGTGEFIQDGGTFGAGASVTIGQRIDGLGTYHMNEGRFYSWWTTDYNTDPPTDFGGPLVVGGAATGQIVNGSFQEGGRFIQNGGSVATDIVVGAQAGSTGLYELNDGSVSDILYLGNSGNGRFVQNGGRAGFQYLYIGFYAGSQGRYDLNGGQVRMWSSYAERIGREGIGIFNQNDGGHIVNGALELGAKAGGYGEYTLAGGDLLVKGNLRVGGNSYANPTAPGEGVFNQNGGFNVINGNLFLSQENAGKGSTGTYNLSEKGVLTVDGKILIADKGIFHQTGGTLNALAGTIVNNGLFHYEDGKLEFGVFSGTGTFEGNMTNSTKVAPGNSPGTLTISGNYTQTASGRLEIEIADYKNFDILRINSGQAFLGGTLDIYLSKGFDPDSGSLFQFLYAENGIDGKFDFLNMPTFNGKSFLIDNSDPNWLALRVAPVPVPSALLLFGSGLVVMVWVSQGRGRKVDIDGFRSRGKR